MKRLGISFFAGFVFAIGLGVSGMTRPSKVIGFLDFTGAWDPSLALVMIGAMMIYFAAWRIRLRSSAPILAAAFSIPERKSVSGALVAGAAIFGVGWGLSGFCPGPAITSLASGRLPVLVFTAAMALGVYLHGAIQKLRLTAGRPVSLAGYADS